jgi:hypothetical protein
MGFEKGGKVVGIKRCGMNKAPWKIEDIIHYMRKSPPVRSEIRHLF